MVSSASLRAQIESTLAPRMLSVFSTLERPKKPMRAIGINALDDLLGGGFPVGAVCEVSGPECSGRTSLALSFLARVSHEGGVCAWIDVTDSFDPESAAAAGVRLSHVLWVRCREIATGKDKRRKPWSRLDQALRAADLVLQAGGFGAVVFNMGSIAAEHALRVPLASWFRFRQAAERTQATFLLLSQASCAKSSAEVRLHLARIATQHENRMVLTGSQFRADLVRDRNGMFAPGKKPASSDTSWSHRATWAGVV